MESQNNSATRMIESTPGGDPNKMRGWDLFFRVAAAALSLTAAVVLGVNKQTTTVAVTLVPALPAVNIPVTAKWHDTSAFVYFVVVNAISALYAVISSLLILIISKVKTKGVIVTMMIVVFDLMVVALLFSSLGATLAVGLISKNGNSHLQWNKVCNVIDKFCNQGAVALGFSAAASAVFFLLVIIGIVKLHKRY